MVRKTWRQQKLLCFMASSIGGQYRDMIAMYPLVKISADILKSTLCKVLKTLSDIGFDVVTNITDGHSANRKLYKCLGGGTLMPSIEHPANSEDTLFLLFDPVHLFKNFYTNLLRKESFKCPKVDKKSVDVCLSHVISLYHRELGKSVKIAHKLSHKVLYPLPIERSKVELADRFFHESTINGLEFYGEIDRPEWLASLVFENY